MNEMSVRNAAQGVNAESLAQTSGFQMAKARQFTTPRFWPELTSRAAGGSLVGPVY